MSVSLDIQDNIATVTMDDGKANVFDHDVVQAFNNIFDQIEADESIAAVIIKGREGFFSAGFDLNYFGKSSRKDIEALVRSGGVLVHRLYQYPKPLIASIGGHAIAMGCFLSLACDVRIGAATKYKIGASETAIGLVIPEFAYELLKSRVNNQHWNEAVLLAELYPPERALEVGYLDKLVDADDLSDVTWSTAEKLRSLPADAYAGTKALIRRPDIERIAKSLGSELID